MNPFHPGAQIGFFNWGGPSSSPIFFSPEKSPALSETIVYDHYGYCYRHN